MGLHSILADCERKLRGNLRFSVVRNGETGRDVVRLL